MLKSKCDAYCHNRQVPRIHVRISFVTGAYDLWCEDAHKKGPLVAEPSSPRRKGRDQPERLPLNASETEAAASFEAQSRATVPPDRGRVPSVRYRQAKRSATDRQYLNLCGCLTPRLHNWALLMTGDCGKNLWYTLAQAIPEDLNANRKEDERGESHQDAGS